MNKCILVLVVGNLSEPLQDFLKTEADKKRIEGTVQADEAGRIRMVICGAKDMIDQFIDKIYAQSSHYELGEIDIEPFFKHKDFRGVFRIVK